LTDTSFSETEMTNLQNVPKYNIHNKPKDWLQKLALEAETAITLPPPSEREEYRKLTAERLNILQENNKFAHAHNRQSASKIIWSCLVQ